jgi:hypothetical protein
MSLLFSLLGGNKQKTNITYNVNVNNGNIVNGNNGNNGNDYQNGQHGPRCNKHKKCRKRRGLFHTIKRMMAAMNGQGGKSFLAMQSGPNGTSIMAGSFNQGPSFSGLSLSA